MKALPYNFTHGECPIEAAIFAGLTLVGKVGFLLASMIPFVGDNGEFEFDIMDDLPDCFDSIFDWNNLFGGN